MKAPLPMPSTGAAQQQFELLRVDYAAPEAGGRIGGVQAGFPLWQAEWRIGRIGVDRSDIWRAFFLRLRGATRRFLGRDLGRPYPKAHIAGFDGMTRAGGGTFDGSATDWSETITADGDSELTLTGLPEDFTLSLGDYVGFQWVATEDAIAGLEWCTVVRVVVGGTTDETGEVTVTTEPPVPTLCVPPTATAHLDNPACVMVLMTDKSSLESIDRRLAITGGTIVAVQDLRA